MKLASDVRFYASKLYECECIDMSRVELNDNLYNACYALVRASIVDASCITSSDDEDLCDDAFKVLEAAYPDDDDKDSAYVNLALHVASARSFLVPPFESMLDMFDDTMRLTRSEPIPECSFFDRFSSQFIDSDFASAPFRKISQQRLQQRKIDQERIAQARIFPSLYPDS